MAHIWPTHYENVHFYGTHSVDIDGELAQLDQAATGRCVSLPAVNGSCGKCPGVVAARAAGHGYLNGAGGRCGPLHSLCAAAV